ncbi:MAG: pyrroline-5-carboxylate reductase [Ruminococcaceae bacterium]|nr:pyrroline-5-carboxylate reductase [Oscillospiraceae bacterium]
MNIGYLGFGQMGSAIAGGLAGFCAEVQSGAIRQLAYAPHADTLHERAETAHVQTCESARELVEQSDMILLACKPYQVEQALKDVKEPLRGKALISIVNAWRFEDFKKLLGGGVRVQCIMPNTPVKVGKGVVLVAAENDFTPEEQATLRAMLGSVSTVVELPGEQFAAASAISGCGPAFLYMVIEALGDAGVRSGLPRRLAYELAAGTMTGAGEMVLRDPSVHPGALKDAVCSPGGTTIRGVAALEESGMRAAFIRAVAAILAT